MTQGLYDTPQGVVLGMEINASDLAPWAPTMVQAREVALNYGITGMHFLTDKMDPKGLRYLPGQDEVEITAEKTRNAFLAGRAIDLGHIPNAVIKFGGQRGRPMWERHGLGMPFRDSWVLSHSWEGGTSLYLVNSAEDLSIEICEFQPVQLKTRPEKWLMIADRAQIVAGSDGRFMIYPAPCPWRFLPGAEQLNVVDGSPEATCIGNVSDPVMTALIILNTRGVDRETVRAPERLQAARVKRGKLPIPNYDRVNSAPYVTAIQLRGTRRERGEDQGGTHRSPMPHVRMGHPRTYAPGRSIFIADTLVNVPEEQRAAFKSGRSHYVVKP